MAPDYKFYNHFKAILERKINQFGKARMEKELLGIWKVIFDIFLKYLNSTKHMDV